MSDLANYRRDLAVLDLAGARIPQIQHSPPTAGPGLQQVAPWMAAGGQSPPLGAVMSSTFYNDSSDNVSTASQLSPAFRLPAARPAAPTPAGSDSPDAAYFGEERRPSIASITTTASSQGSKTSGARGGFRKLQGFFGEEFPGRDSSDTSLAQSTGKEYRSHSHSHARPHRDRNYSNATDHTRDASPASSRPRTPVPAPEVVPFLYQDAEVGPCPPPHRLRLPPPSGRYPPPSSPHHSCPPVATPQIHHPPPPKSIIPPPQMSKVTENAAPRQLRIGRRCRCTRPSQINFLLLPL